MRKPIIIFDNCGKTCDRYTGVITETGDILSFNETPFHPAYGIGQFCGNVTDRMNITYGYYWRNHFSEKKVLKQELNNYLNEARSNNQWLGQEIEMDTLTFEAKQYVKNMLENN